MRASADIAYMRFVIPILGDAITKRRCPITVLSCLNSQKGILVACLGGLVTMTTGTIDFLRHQSA